MKKKRLYFISTDHLESRIWFRDDEDFKAGMNYVAVTVAVTGVTVIAFILMSNHVHFLLVCEDEEAARNFINHFKKLFSTYYRNKYGEGRLLRRNNIDIQEVIVEDESVERVIAYIVMNSVAAKVCAAANGYRWGSGACFFNDYKENGSRIDSMSARSRINILRSKSELPDNWLLSSEGYVLPESYIPIKKVEDVYKSSSRYNYFLNNSSKAKKRWGSEGPSFRDQIVKEGLRDLCISLFSKNGPEELSSEEKTEIAKQMSWRFNADSHQISRVSGFSYPEVTKMLCSI